MYVNDDMEGVSHPLTPAHLIYGQQIIRGPSECQFDITNVNQSLTRRAKHQFKLLNDFTWQWQWEYLLGLREHGNYSRESHGQSWQQIKPGDIVILKDDLTHRSWWKLARVSKLITGRDGHARAGSSFWTKRRHQTYGSHYNTLLPLKCQWSNNRGTVIICQNSTLSSNNLNFNYLRVINPW